DHDHAIELQPDDAWIIANRGDTLYAMARYGDALAAYNRAIELDADNATYRSDRGNVHRGTGRYEEALDDYTRATELDPDNAWHRMDRGITLRLLGRAEERDELRRAVELYSAEIENSGGDLRTAHLRGNLVIVHCAAHAWEKASEELESFLGCAPGTRRIQEALKDLADLQKALGGELPEIRTLRLRLESVAAQGA
ncbi:hypothetical protein DBP19_17995, partial [Streptomyces sp. CS090A]|uniref:tetratricopeptide repeat protein n=1 Tax=Streptomyces sp. CS090A TaxID=2162710 RepID=UPI000D517245